jgi:hypothetical protein
MIRVGITTIPERLPFIDETIGSLLNQTVKPDMIYLNLPIRSRRGQPYPRYAYDHPLVTINECKDMGPVTKLYPLLSISRPDDVIVLADDDILYNEFTIETLTRQVEIYSSVGFSGRVMQNGELKFMTNVSSPETADFLETFSGVAYKRWTLKNEDAIDRIFNRCNESLYCDDIVIGSILNIPPHLIPYGKYKSSYNYHLSDTPALYTNNIIGRRNERVYKCVRSFTTGLQ